MIMANNYYASTRFCYRALGVLLPRGNFVVVGVKRSFTIETTHHHDGTRSLASSCVPQLLCRRRFSASMGLLSSMRRIRLAK